jgi:hypothetical protein
MDRNVSDGHKVKQSCPRVHLSLIINVKPGNRMDYGCAALAAGSASVIVIDDLASWLISKT